MTRQSLDGTLLDEQVWYSLADVCEVCGSEQEWVIALIEQGIVEPSGKRKPQWRFSGSSLHTVMKARRLQQDFELNIAGVALALELLNEIDALRSHIRALGTDT